MQIDAKKNMFLFCKAAEEEERKKVPITRQEAV